MAEPKVARVERRDVNVSSSEEDARLFESQEQSSPETSVETGVESGIETTAEQEVSGAGREGEREQAVEPTTPSSSPASVISIVKNELTQRVESILEEGLTEVYEELPERDRPAFKARGEEIADTIRVMMQTAKFSFKKVISLIREWLQMIPGVNRFFLEQEAKIKADQLSHLAEEEYSRRNNQT